MQEDIQYYFDIADSLLKDLNATQRESKPDTDPNRCVACGSVDLVLCYADGCYVCSKCGEVAMQPVFERAQMFVRKFSNYKRIHHFHERVSQFMLAESFIPEADMCRIKEAFQKSGHASYSLRTPYANDVKNNGEPYGNLTSHMLWIYACTFVCIDV